MPRTVYAVSAGSYSDYRVVCLFEHESDAQAHARERNEHGYSMLDDADVETFTLYAAGEAPQRITWWRVVAYVNADGEVVEEEERQITVWRGDGEVWAPKRPKADAYKVRSGKVRVVADAEDYQAARKVFGDAVAQAQAQMDPSIL